MQICNLIKNPQLAMSMQQIKISGHDFPKDKEGEIFNLWGQWVKSKCQRDNPSKCQLPFLSHSPNHLILPKMVELVNAWRWERVWQSEIRIEEVFKFWKTFF